MTNDDIAKAITQIGFGARNSTSGDTIVDVIHDLEVHHEAISDALYSISTSIDRSFNHTSYGSEYEGDYNLVKSNLEIAYSLKSIARAIDQLCFVIQDKETTIKIDQGD